MYSSIVDQKNQIAEYSLNSKNVVWNTSDKFYGLTYYEVSFVKIYTKVYSLNSILLSFDIKVTMDYYACGVELI